MSLYRRHLAYYRAAHTVASPCPECGERTYGPVDTVSPSGPKRHLPECRIPDYCCRCGSRKRRWYRLCLSCHTDDRHRREAEAGVMAREQDALLTDGPVISECAFCGGPAVDGDPLGLYGPYRVTAHFYCYVDNEYAKVEVARDQAGEL